MRVIFIRHGHPDYSNDCLTELGHKQAEAAAHRLADETIHHIYSSPLGRAVETAAHIADARGMEIEYCDFMREFGGAYIDDNGEVKEITPWAMTEPMVAAGKSVTRENWADQAPFYENKIVSRTMRIGNEFDRLIAGFGYEREGNFYRVRENNNDNIVIASHAGSSCALLSYIFNLPLPFVYAAIRPGYTSITVVKFFGEEGKIISPRFEIMTDARHIENIDANTLGNETNQMYKN